MAAYKIPQRQLHPVGRCIYCGYNGPPDRLTREHIFPFSLGGVLVLPKSSCYQCAYITKNFEHTCARKMFGKLRIIFDLPTSHKKERPKELPLTIESDGVNETIMVEIADYPASPIIFPIFGPPEILLNLPPGEVFRDASVIPVLPVVADNEARLSRLRQRVGRPVNITVNGTAPIGAFARLLAKIAHANAVAEFGIGAFTPLLPDIILGRSQCTPYLVGGMRTPDTILAPEFTDGTHRLFFGLATVTLSNYGRDAEESHYLIAAIRLFKDLQSPTYCVVIGIPNRELITKLEQFVLPGSPAII